MEQKPIEITYEEPKLGGSPGSDINLETILGTIPQVSTAPTWVPKLFKDNFAFYKNGATIRFYIYDSLNNAWHYSTLT